MSQVANVPRLKRWTCGLSWPIAGRRVAGTYYFAFDNETGLTEMTIATSNVILDIINSPNPTAVGTATEARNELELWKNGIATGRYFYSDAMNAASAGRMAVGPIALNPGRISFRNRTLSATSTEDFSFIIKLARA